MTLDFNLWCNNNSCNIHRACKKWTTKAAVVHCWYLHLIDWIKKDIPLIKNEGVSLCKQHDVLYIGPMHRQYKTICNKSYYAISSNLLYHEYFE